ncbi:MAG: sigma-70 family RNA polymerase sigma factor [Planctomycetia bacterium]|nr:sigma-70 family RNA polymerase sigma factor [Planctomycetia bacterium]
MTEVKAIDPIQEKAGKLFMQHYPLIRHIALMNAPVRDLRDDIVNDAYVSFVENAYRYDLESDVRPLLRTIVVARAKDHWRNHLRQLPEPIVQLLEVIQKDMELKDDPARFLTLDEELAALDACLSKLSPEARDLIQKVYFDGMTVAEIARDARLNPDNLYKTMLKIRLVLRNCMDKSYSGEPL